MSDQNIISNLVSTNIDKSVSLLSQLDIILASIEDLINQFENIHMTSLNTKKTINSLKNQYGNIQEYKKSLNEFTNKFINDIYNLMYNVLRNIAQYNAEILENTNTFIGVNIIDAFGGFTNEDNIPTNGGHYRKSTNINTDIDYTLQHCVEIESYINKEIEILQNKIESINNIIANINKNLELGYEIGLEMPDLLNIIKDAIPTKITEWKNKLTSESANIESAFQLELTDIQSVADTVTGPDVNIIN